MWLPKQIEFRTSPLAEKTNQCSLLKELEALTKIGTCDLGFALPLD
jgi:hypothetical protein